MFAVKEGTAMVDLSICVMNKATCIESQETLVYRLSYTLNIKYFPSGENFTTDLRHDCVKRGEFWLILQLSKCFIS